MILAPARWSAVATGNMAAAVILVLDGEPVRTPVVLANADVLSEDTGVVVPEDVKGAV